VLIGVVSIDDLLTAIAEQLSGLARLVAAQQYREAIRDPAAGRVVAHSE
jgi:hypothetical protein